MRAGLNPYVEYKESGIRWLGKIPSHWMAIRLKHLLTRNDSGVWGEDARGGDGTIVLRSTEQTVTGLWKITSPAQRRLSPSEYQNSLLQEGDLVVTKSSGSALHIGKTSIVTRDIEELRCCFSNFMQRLRLDRRQALPRFVWYVISGDFVRKQFEFFSDTTTGLANLNASLIGAVRFAVPPLVEQTAIARFLDYMDRRIQQYIRAKEKLIALLDEYKQAYIHQAVTGQIDVRTGEPYSEYKESGVEWLPKIPAHWQMRRSKRVYRPRKELAKLDDIQLSATQAFGVIGQEDYEKRIGRKIVRISLHLEKRRHVEPDDFIISMRSFQGGLERAWVRGCIRSSYVVLRPATEVVVPFFGFLFKSVGYISALQATANFIRDGQDLNFDNFCRVEVPFPPLEEQRRIAQVLDRMLKAVVSTIERTDSKVNLLREYRTRLIANVVIGKFYVREIETSLPNIGRRAPEATPSAA